MEHVCDVGIIGGGAAGLSAALMLGRARRTVKVVDDGHQRNRPVRESHGFLGHDGLSPSELLARARSQLDRYPTIECLSDHVTEIDGGIDDFHMHMQSGDSIRARRILFATGLRDDLPDLPGLAELWGKRVFVCPYCDGWEFRDRRMAVIGTERGSLELAQELWDWSHDLVVCSLGGVPVPPALEQWRTAAGVDVVEAPAAIREDGKIVIDCASGAKAHCDVIFVCAPLKQHSPLPERIGCLLTEQGTIDVDAAHRTSVPGCYAAGDCITQHHQIVFAAASAARAAIALNEEFYQSDAAALVRSKIGA